LSSEITRAGSQLGDCLPILQKNSSIFLEFLRKKYEKILLNSKIGPEKFPNFEHQWMKKSRICSKKLKV
jgi:hypothetical protein